MSDDAADLCAQLQAVTGERIAALEGIGEMARAEPAKAVGEGQGLAGKERDIGMSGLKDREPTVPERGKWAGMEGLID